MNIAEQMYKEALLVENLNRLKKAEKIARSGHIDLNLVTGEITWSDETFRIHGCDPKEFKPTLENTIGFLHPEDADFVKKELELAMAGLKKYELLHRIINTQGDTLHVSVNADLTYNASDEPVKMLGTITDITDIIDAKQRENLRTQVLELLAKDTPLKTLLDTMLLGVEQYSPGTFSSILLMDREGKCLLHGSAPSLPDFYNQAIHGGEIGMGVGSCFTAAFIGERVIVEDIQNHPYWKDYKDLAKKAGLASCWSEPIKNASGKVLGSFAIYNAQPSSPKPKDIELIENLANLSAIVLERFYASSALKESEERYRELIEQASDGIFIFDAKGKFLEVNASGTTMTGYTKAEIRELGIEDLIHENDLKTKPLKLRELFAGKQLIFERKIQRKDGSLFDAEISAKTIGDGKALAIMRNITQRKKADLALIESERKLALTLDSTEDMMGLADFNENGEFTFNTANRATRESFNLMQVDEKEYFGAELKSYCVTYLGFTKEEARELEKKYQSVIKERKSVKVLSSSPSPQGGLLHFETTINPVIDENGKIEQVLWINKEVTEKIKTEERLKISEQKLNEAQKIAKIGSWEFDFSSQYLSWSEEQYRLLELEGTPQDQLLKAFNNKVHPDDFPKFELIDQQAIKTGKSFSYEYRVICNDNSIKYILTIGKPIKDKNGKVTGLQGTDQEITHKVEAQKKLLQSMISGEEKERKRFAAELHDSVGQTLSLISLNLDSIINLKEEKSDLSKQKLQASLEMVNQTIEEIRTISHGLTPQALEDYGLKSVLKNMLNKARLATGISVDFSFADSIDRSSSDIEINIYRIAQEALNNTLKHANAQKVSMEIYKKDTFLFIDYKDDGQGFDLVKNKKAFHGLRNIENRVYVLGGTLSVQSKPNQGTSLNIKIPF